MGISVGLEGVEKVEEKNREESGWVWIEDYDTWVLES